MTEQMTASAQMVMQQMSMSYATAQAISVAAQLGVADCLADGAKGCDVLAQALDAHESSLRRLMRLLASIGVFAEDDQGRFGLTALGACLRSDVPDSVRSRVIMFAQPWVWRPFMELFQTVKTGESAFRLAHGMSYFDYLREHPEANRIFHEGLKERTGEQAPRIAQAYDFTGMQTVVDIGGGTGVLLAAILKAYPTLHGVLYDLPHVIDSARPVLEAAGVANRCDTVSGDFFVSVPEGDAYVLSRILHDWGDAPSRTILRHCRKAMSPGGKLLIVEAIIKPSNVPDFGKLSDLYMLVLMDNGFEREADEFRALLGSAGFSLVKIWPVDGVISVIEAVPV
jgi:hypothetical protein